MVKCLKMVSKFLFFSNLYIFDILHNASFKIFYRDNAITSSIYAKLKLCRTIKAKMNSYARKYQKILVI